REFQIQLSIRECALNLSFVPGACDFLRLLLKVGIDVALAALCLEHEMPLTRNIGHLGFGFRDQQSEDYGERCQHDEKFHGFPFHSSHLTLRCRKPQTLRSRKTPRELCRL